MSSLLLLACLALTSSARAQVNTESLRNELPDSGFMGDLKADLGLKGGNADLTQVAGTARLAYLVGRHIPLVYGRAEYGQAGGEDFVKNAFTHARWTAMWLPRVGTEVFAQVQADALLRMRLRWLLGAGPRFGVLLTEKVKLHVGTGYMLEREVLSIPADDPHPSRTLYHRSTNYAALKVQVTDILSLTNVAYVQPRFDRLSDVRLLDEFELQVQVGKHLQLVNTIRAAYDSDPPRAVKARYDLGLTAGVRLAL